VLVARRIDRLEALAEELGDRCEVVAVDISSPDAADRVVEQTIACFGRLDILVNAAGISRGGIELAEDESLDEFTRIQLVNVAGVFGLCKRAGMAMLESRWGRIINIGSIFGQVAPPGDIAYAASKAAIVGLTRALAMQWSRRGVTVNCLAPGFFPSEMTMEYIGSGWFQELVKRRCPLGRTGRIEELDGALLFLSSSASSYCTGQVLAIDGGWTAA
jgi:NAD(P)-dependent dehydrogenase (short-subunit alcohol dehydrogenase family)